MHPFKKEKKIPCFSCASQYNLTCFHALDQGLASYTPWANPAGSMFLNKSPLQHNCTQLSTYHLWLFSCYTVEVSSCERQHIAYRAKIIYHLALYKKMLPTSRLDIPLVLCETSLDISEMCMDIKWSCWLYNLHPYPPTCCTVPIPTRTSSRDNWLIYVHVSLCILTHWQVTKHFNYPTFKKCLWGEAVLSKAGK